MILVAGIFHRIAPRWERRNERRSVNRMRETRRFRSPGRQLLPLLGLAVFAEKEYKMWPRSRPGREACNYHEWAIYLSLAFAVAEEGQLEEERIFFAGRGRPWKESATRAIKVRQFSSSSVTQSVANLISSFFSSSSSSSFPFARDARAGSEPKRNCRRVCWRVEVGKTCTRVRTLTSLVIERIFFFFLVSTGNVKFAASNLQSTANLNKRRKYQ